jgi:GT2 family glycosyltransferase
VSSILLTWVIVSYGGVDDARRLIDSLGATDQPERQCRVLLACNKPGDAQRAAEVFRSESERGRSAVRVLDFGDNPGYLPAVHRAVEQEGLEGALVFSNSDLVAEASTLPALRQELARWPGALSLAPAVIGAVGADQNPHLLAHPSALRLTLLGALHRVPQLADVLLLRRAGHSSTLVAGGVAGQTMWAGHGSCVVLTPEFFSRGGRLDYQIPLFGEELWIGSEVERLGGEVRYTPSVVLHHREHATTGASRRRGRVARIKYDSLRYWARQARARGW